MANEITWFRGDSYPKVFTFTNKATGVALDFAEVTEARLTVNAEEDPVDDANQLFSVVGTILGNGQISFVLEGDTVGDFFYDVQIVGAGWGPKTLVKSSYTITQDITKV